MAARRALTERARRSDGATRIGEHDEAAAESIDDRSAAVSTTRDGGIRKDRGPPSVRVQGRGHALARTAEMRVNALIDAPPSEAAGDLAYLTTRARILALNMLPLEPCARIVHAMEPKRRAEVIDAVDPRVGEMVTQLLIDRGEAVNGGGAAGCWVWSTAWTCTRRSSGAAEVEAEEPPGVFCPGSSRAARPSPRNPRASSRSEPRSFAWLSTRTAT